MKKILLSILLAAATTGVYAQRMIDLEVTMTTPVNGTVVDGTKDFNLKVTVKNLGPETIKTTDTLAIGFTLDNSTTLESCIINGTTAQSFLSPVTSAIAPNATASINVNMKFANAPSNGSHPFCVLALIRNSSADSVKDNALTNNQSCANITVAPTSVASIGTGAMGNVYPNPAVDVAHVDVEMYTAAPVVLTLTDFSGRVIRKENKGLMQPGKATLQLNVTDVPAGSYIYHISVGDGLQHGKLTVAH